MKTTLLLSLTAGALVLAGCGNPPDAATYVDPNGQHTVVNVDRINIQDFSTASDDLVQSLLKSGVLERAEHQPAVLAISRITNDTDQQFDTDLLTKNIRVALLNTGKVVTTTIVGPGGNVEDPEAQSLIQRNAFLNGQSAPNPEVDYTLSGKIMVDKTNAGDTRQSSYIFDLSLTDIRNGTAVWEDQRTITKQGRTSSIGW
jgi:penicillin-binding protein activator